MHQHRTSPQFVRRKLLEAEPLERRRLLSGDAGPLQAITSPGDGFRNAGVETGVELLAVVEQEPSDDFEDDQPVDFDDLPSKIVASLRALFPNSQIDGVVRSEEEDGSIEYDAEISRGMSSTFATFTPEGSLIETEQPLVSGDLPAAVLKWVEQYFSDASISQASLIDSAGEQNYELVVTDHLGRQFEANLRSTRTTSMNFSPAVETSCFSIQEHLSDAISAEEEIDTALVTGSNHADLTVKQIDVAAASTAIFSCPPIHAEVPPNPPADGAAPVVPTPQFGEVTIAANNRGGQSALVREGWKPAVADLLAGVFSLDSAATERGIEELLREIDLATQKMLHAHTTTNVWSTGVSVTVLVGGQFLIRRRRRGGFTNALIPLDPASISWGWRLHSPSFSK